MRSALFLFAIFAIAFSQHIGVDRMYGDLPGYPVELTEDPTWQACEKLYVLLVHLLSPVCLSFLEIFLLSYLSYFNQSKINEFTFFVIFDSGSYIFLQSGTFAKKIEPYFFS